MTATYVRVIDCTDNYLPVHSPVRIASRSVDKLIQWLTQKHPGLVWLLI
jgi:hypothetical protein